MASGTARSYAALAAQLSLVLLVLCACTCDRPCCPPTGRAHRRANTEPLTSDASENKEVVEDSDEFEVLRKDYAFYDELDPKVLMFPDAKRNPNFKHEYSEPVYRASYAYAVDASDLSESGDNQIKPTTPKDDKESFPVLWEREAGETPLDDTSFTCDLSLKGMTEKNWKLDAEIKTNLTDAEKRTLKEDCKKHCDNPTEQAKCTECVSKLCPDYVEQRNIKPPSEADRNRNITKIPYKSQGERNYTGDSNRIKEELPPKCGGESNFAGDSKRIKGGLSCKCEGEPNCAGDCNRIKKELTPKSGGESNFAGDSNRIKGKLPPKRGGETNFAGDSNRIKEKQLPKSGGEPNFAGDSNRIKEGLLYKCEGEPNCAGDSKRIEEKLPSKSGVEPNLTGDPSRTKEKLPPKSEETPNFAGDSTRIKEELPYKCEGEPCCAVDSNRIEKELPSKREQVPNSGGAENEHLYKSEYKARSGSRVRFAVDVLSDKDIEDRVKQSPEDDIVTAADGGEGACDIVKEGGESTEPSSDRSVSDNVVVASETRHECATDCSDRVVTEEKDPSAIPDKQSLSEEEHKENKTERTSSMSESEDSYPFLPPEFSEKESDLLRKKKQINLNP